PAGGPCHVRMLESMTADLDVRVETSNVMPAAAGVVPVALDAAASGTPASSSAEEPCPTPEHHPLEEPGYRRDSRQLAAAAPAIKDELDADLLAVFSEEGQDMLPQMRQLLRAWQQNPSDASLPQGVLRTLHSVKSSARMAGAMMLGQHLHEMETRIENITHAG